MKKNFRIQKITGRGERRGKKKIFQFTRGQGNKRSCGGRKGENRKRGGKIPLVSRKQQHPTKIPNRAGESTGSKAIRQRTLHVETTRGEEERTSASPIPLSKRLRHHKSSVCVFSTRQNSSPHHAHVHTPSTAGGKWLEDKVKGATPSTFLSLSHPLVLINRDVSFSGPHPPP